MAPEARKVCVTVSREPLPSMIMPPFRHDPLERLFSKYLQHHGKVEADEAWSFEALPHRHVVQSSINTLSLRKNQEVTCNREWFL